MLTRDEIKYHRDGCCTSTDCNMSRKALGDEIDRLEEELDAALMAFFITRNDFSKLKDACGSAIREGSIDAIRGFGFEYLDEVNHVE